MHKHADGDLSTLPALPAQITKVSIIALDGLYQGGIPRSEGAARDGMRNARARLADQLADHLGHEQQVVVVHDDEVAGLVDLGAPLGKEQVGRLVGSPHWVWRGQRDGRVEPEEVVEEGPQGCDAPC